MKWYIIVIYFLCVLNVQGQAVHPPEKGYLKSYLTDTRLIIEQPLRWKGKQWLAFGGAAATFGVLFANDLNIHTTFQRNRTSGTAWVSQYMAEPFGSGLYTLPALGILYGAGWLSENEKNRYVALKGMEAWILTGGATLVLKQLAHRQRPNEGNQPNPYFWRGPYALTSNSTSFPSGHTSTAFAVAAVIAGSYDVWWIKTLSYGCATLTGLSRIHDGKHWASDVFAGALLGWWIGHSVLKNAGPVLWGVSGSSNQFSGTLVWRF